MFVDDYASVVSHWKWAPQKRPVIAHIKARSKHSFETDTALHTKQLHTKICNVFAQLPWSLHSNRFARYYIISMINEKLLKHFHYPIELWTFLSPIEKPYYCGVLYVAIITDSYYKALFMKHPSDDMLSSLVPRPLSAFNVSCQKAGDLTQPGMRRHVKNVMMMQCDVITRSQKIGQRKWAILS